MKMKVYGVSGTATTGKDKFANLAVEYFQSLGLKAQRFALADNLKSDLSDFVSQNFGFSIFNATNKEKALIRPIMVAYGCAKREQSNGTYWTQKLEDQINKYDLDVCIISDIRFAHYEHDEHSWLKNKLNGKLIHLTRWNDGIKIPPANEEERIQDPKIKLNSDYLLDWNTDESSCYGFVSDFFSKLL